MPKFGTRSLKVRDELHPDLIRVLDEAIKITDFSLYCGHRTNEEQDYLFRIGRSKARAGQSKHNRTPSEAVDLWAYPINWEETEQQAYIAGIIIGVAHGMGIGIRWGHDWDQDGDIRDNSFDDSPHFELE